MCPEGLFNYMLLELRLPLCYHSHFHLVKTWQQEKALMEERIQVVTGSKIVLTGTRAELLIDAAMSLSQPGQTSTFLIFTSTHLQLSAVETCLRGAWHWVPF